MFVVATTTILALQLFNEPFILQSPAPPAGPPAELAASLAAVIQFVE